MVYPSVMFLEMAKDTLKAIPPEKIELLKKALTSFGDTRAQEMGASGISQDLIVGYLLGLTTMRVVVLGTPAANLQNVLR